ncbi:MAG: tetratricopeptide repeat protein [Sphingobacteriales bacterium]|nr:MAG: tetratricopeptide repeat protein [Sphingobacteriales bacterium]
MKPTLKHFITLIVLTFTLTSYAQDARSLVKEGITLNNAKQYAGAIEKYKAALSLEPDNATANYQIAFTLNTTGKATDALPYLQKVVAADASPAVIASAYGLMGSIYDKTAQPQKAVECYLQAIKTDPANYMTHYNLGLTYFRIRQYAEAEKSALAALAIDPKHNESIRLYALVTFHQDKRAAALMALCRYLSLVPAGPKSTEAYGNLQSILKGGALKAEPGVKPPVADAQTRELNRAITTAVNTVDKQKYTSPATLLSKQLSVLFTQLGPIVEKQTANTPFFSGLAAQYYQLAQTDRMMAFANFISQSGDKSAAAWVKAHSDIMGEEW